MYVYIKQISKYFILNTIILSIYVYIRIYMYIEYRINTKLVNI